MARLMIEYEHGLTRVSVGRVQLGYFQRFEFTTDVDTTKVHLSPEPIPGDTPEHLMPAKREHLKRLIELLRETGAEVTCDLPWKPEA